MTTFLLLVSLTLNIVAIFAVILLYLRQNRLMQAENKQETILREMEELFSAYLIEMKEENDQFITRLKQALANGVPAEKSGMNEAEGTGPVPFNVQAASEGYRDDNGGPVGSEPKQENGNLPRTGKGVTFYAAKTAYQQNKEFLEDKPVPSVPPVPDSTINPGLAELNHQESLLNQVLALQKQGFSIEETARTLNKGQTEIELLLKFQQNKQE
ncbi:hypothetical protein [Bacillus sp. T33-2]|uniref:hypothetical protein n=1 Tax=Bacillus sp. T33-2 TaxID=2054168 RepID=UPI000C784D93|nr:hypothetical protein [Bacillus sp. T33-2]PLR97251.1 hypothetical protein CVD19_07100 [Bacillus sp. T33-2]